MPSIANLVHETSATTGTGNLTVASVNGKQRLSDAFGTGSTEDVFYYFISNRSEAEWEVGTGHMSDANTLVRDTVLASTNSNNAVNFSAGTKDVTNDFEAAALIAALDGKADEDFSGYDPKATPVSADTLLINDSEDGGAAKETTVGGLQGALLGREILTANRDYFVNVSTGDDGNDGLSSGSPFETIQHAIDVAAALDLSVYDVTINIADGTYAVNVQRPFVLKRALGAGRIHLLGNTSTPGNVILTSNVASARIVSAENSAGQGDVVTTYTLRGVRLTATSGSGTRNLIHVSGATNLIFSHVEFGAATNQIRADTGANVVADGPYSIVDSASRHVLALQGGHFDAQGQTVTLTGTPAFSNAFVVADRTGHVSMQGMTFSGSATGSRFLVQNVAVIFTNGSNPSTYFPGNSSGTEDTATSGHYV
jgi:hypothetical protein